jgi:hypothetical protein
MWPRFSPWPGTTKQYSGEGQEILIDGGAFDKVRSENGKTELSAQ